MPRSFTLFPFTHNYQVSVQPQKKQTLYCDYIIYLCKKLHSLYKLCKGDIVVGDIKLQTSPLQNSNFIITLSVGFVLTLCNGEVRDIWRFKLWYLPLKRLVTLTTVLCYRAACDVMCNCNYHFNKRYLHFNKCLISFYIILSAYKHIY